MAGDLQNIEIISPSSNTKFYKGRWQNLTNQTGRFIARKPQRFGAKLWCYIETKNGMPCKLIDFPNHKNINRGCDEAWYLQSAIDRFNNNPQHLAIKKIDPKNAQIEHFSPIPMWAQKYLDAMGEPLENHNCLFAYLIPNDILNKVVKFFEERLWLQPNYI